MLKSKFRPDRSIGTFVLVTYLSFAGIISDAHAENTDFELGKDCGSLKNGFGPYDYTNAEDVRNHLPIVERFHFSTEVEGLRAGQTSEQPGGDLDYTLRAFPNHHRALYAMVKYHLMFRDLRVPPGAQYSAECYLLRAIRFRAGDAKVHLISGIYLARIGRVEDAVQSYERAVELAPDSAEAHYNLALQFMEAGNDESALNHAKIAYELGYPLPGLKRRLKTDGVWQTEQ